MNAIFQRPAVARTLLNFGLFILFNIVTVFTRKAVKKWAGNLLFRLVTAQEITTPSSAIYLKASANFTTRYISLLLVNILGLEITHKLPSSIMSKNFSLSNKLAQRSEIV